MALSRNQALDKFEREMDDIDLLAIRARANVQQAEAELAAIKNRIQDIERCREETPSAELDSEFDQFLQAQDSVDAELRAWRHILNRIPVFYSAAWEVFLEDFLAEQMGGSSLLEGWLERELGVKLKQTAAPEPDQLRQCIQRLRRRSLQDVENVPEVFKAVLSRNPFQFTANSVFSDGEELAGARADLELLLVLRHELVHNGGEGGHKYRRSMAWQSGRFQSRLAEAFPEYQHTPPPPGKVLESPARDGNGKKVDEMGRSLRRLAQYIAETCVVQERTPSNRALAGRDH
jgi:hypothetical protein